MSLVWSHVTWRWQWFRSWDAGCIQLGLCHNILVTWNAIHIPGKEELSLLFHFSFAAVVKFMTNLKLMKTEDEVIMERDKIPVLPHKEIMVETVSNTLKTWWCKCRRLSPIPEIMELRPDYAYFSTFKTHFLKSVAKFKCLWTTCREILRTD